MSKRHVHFADTNLVYSPPSTPSPTFSESSLPSSYGPATPSSGLYSALSLPADPACAVRVNPIIGSALTGPPIVYDLSLQPSLVRTRQDQPLSPTVLSEAATASHIASLNLISNHLPWTLIVVPIHSSPHPDPFVTVSDVLKTLYSVLRLAVTPAEYDALPSREAKFKVVAAYERRCSKSGSGRAYEEEKRKGVKRVDFLMGRTKFAGLSPISNSAQSGTWLLHVL